MRTFTGLFGLVRKRSSYIINLKLKTLYFIVLHKKEEKSEKSDKNHGNKFSKLLTKVKGNVIFSNR